MRPITLTGFSGSNSAVDPRQLPEAVGVYMANAYPGLGDLRPLNNHLTVATVPTSPQRRTIWRMGRDVASESLYWLGWSGVVSVTPGFGTDPTERTYYANDGTPKWTNNDIGLTGGPPYPQGSRELSVPAPTTAPTVVLDVNGTTGSDATRFYVETYVNDLGWESAPSPPSTGIVCKPGATLDITGLSTPPSGSYGLVARRIYRTQNDTGNSADFYLLREITIGTTTTEDDARVLGELLPTEGYLPPPADSTHILALWNSIMVVLAGKEVCFCEAGFPYAYPLRYRKELKSKGVGLAKFGQNVVVVTTGAPVLYQGQSPDGMQEMPPMMAQACVSATSVVSFPHGAAWASNEGYAYCGDRGQLNLTENVLTAEQWRALVPSTMVAGRWGRFIVCSYDDGTRKGFMLDPLRPEAGIVWLTTGFNACYYDEISDQLFVLEGGNVRKFAGGTTKMTAVFWSKQYLQPFPMVFGAAKVVATGYPVSLEVWADGAQKLARSVASREGFTLPDGFTAEEWQLRLSTANDLPVARMATRMQELKGI